MTRNTVVAALFLLGLGALAIFYVSTRPAPVVEVEKTEPETVGGDKPGPYLQIEVAGEARGTITIDLMAELAPGHAERITTLAAEGAYDGVVFHRVIQGFMAQTGDVQFGKQGGDMRSAGSGGSDMADLKAEFSNERFLRGVVGMARGGHSIDSANSQFFIMFEPGEFLNGDYTVVGRVTDGMDVVDAIKRGHPQSGAVTGKPDVMTKVTVSE